MCAALDPRDVQPLQRALVGALLAIPYEQAFAGASSRDAVQLASGGRLLQVQDPRFWRALERLSIQCCTGASGMTTEQVSAAGCRLAIWTAVRRHVPPCSL
jgi:hypothetical protein